MARAMARPQDHRYRRGRRAGKTKISFDNVTIEKATEYAAEDADVTLRLWQVLKPRLTAEHMRPSTRRWSGRWCVLARMERRGISVDRQVLSRLSGEFAQEAPARGGDQGVRRRAAQSRLAQAARRHPVRQARPAGRQEDQDRRSRRPASVLEELAEQGHGCRRRSSTGARWRSCARPTPTRCRATSIRPQPGPTCYALAATTTGRLSSSEPTCRTSRCAPRKAARSAAPSSPIPATNWCPPTIPRSSCGCSPRSPTSRVAQAFRDGLDIHAMTASEMFGVPVAGMPGEVRRRAKAINFGIIYGISAFGLANQLGIGREEAGAYIKKYFERFPGIRDYIEATKAFARRTATCSRCSAANATIPTSALPTPRSARSTSAPPSTRACRAPPPTSSAAP